MKGIFTAGGIECILTNSAKVGGLEELAFSEAEIQDAVHQESLRLSEHRAIVNEWLRIRKLSHPLPEAD